MQATNIADSWVPRWTFDATILPKSRTKILFNCCQLVEEVILWNSGKHLAGNYGLRKSASSLEKQPSVMPFFDALITAKKGEPRPKFLWSTVNLLLVERGDKDNVARRVGVGRVIFEAWLFKCSKPEEVILLKNFEHGRRGYYSRKVGLSFLAQSGSSSKRPEWQ